MSTGGTPLLSADGLADNRSRYRVGEPIQYQHGGASMMRFEGRVAGVNPDGTYEVYYYNKAVAHNVPESFLNNLPQAHMNRYPDLLKHLEDGKLTEKDSQFLDVVRASNQSLMGDKFGGPSKLEFMWWQKKTSELEEGSHMTLFCVLGFAWLLSFATLFFTPDNGKVMVIVALATSLVFTIRPLYYHWEICGHDFQFEWGQAIVPIICICFCLSSGAFPIEVVWAAIKGESIHPWQVLGVLYSLCYLCISLDITGVLEAMAVRVSQAAAPSPLRLFVYLYLFSAVLTIFTNNDITILCLTPLVIATANASGINPEPFVFTLLFSANTFSLAVMTGNPANLIAAEAAGFNYTAYLERMFLTAMVGALVLFFQCWFMFSHQIRDSFEGETENWLKRLKYPTRAVICIVRLLLLVVLLALVPVVQAATGIKPKDNLVVEAIDLWFAAGVGFTGVATDLIMDVMEKKEKAKHLAQLREAQSSRDEEPSFRGAGDDIQIELRLTNDPMANIYRSVANYDEEDAIQGGEAPSFTEQVLVDLPWKLVPFVCALFTIVQFMKHVGIVSWTANLLKSVSSVRLTLMLVVAYGVITLCQLINNQPTTVFISKTILAMDVEVNVKRYAQYAMAVASNYGGNGTPVGSLAVMMWRGVMEKRGLYCDYFRFSEKGLIVMPLPILFSILFLHGWLFITDPE